MHPFLVLEHLRENFKDYVLSKYPWTSADPEHQKLAELCLQPGQVFQDAVIQLERPRKKSAPLKGSEPAFFHPKLAELLKTGFPPKKEGRLRKFDEPFLHQLLAWERISAGKPTVVSTGTGSGKSEAFMFPLLDRVYKSKLQDNRGSNTQRNIRAIVIYPMNALIEDQHVRFCRYAYQLGLKVGVYNGSFNEQRNSNNVHRFTARLRKNIFGTEEVLMNDSQFQDVTELINPAKADTYPDILLTNYSMLQYMLLRKEEHAIFKDANIQALALDEAHLYSGTLGLEMAALLARLRNHIEAMNGTFKNFVPVATSATLVRGGDPDSISRMRDFFESLFSAKFDDEYLIQDQFIDPTPPVPTLWSDFQLPHAEISKAIDTARKNTDSALELLKKNVFPTIANPRAMAEQLPAILLSELKPHEQSDMPLDSVVTVEDAVRRYAFWRLGRELSKSEREIFSAELSALLTFLSLPTTQISSTGLSGPSSPLLGLRLHSFTRSEPRVYREFKPAKNGNLQLGSILSEDEVTDYNTMHEDEPLFALPAAFCKNCGHEGWVAVAEDSGLGNEFLLTPLKSAPKPDELIFVLHPADIDDDEFVSTWKKELYDVSLNPDGSFKAMRIRQAQARPNALDALFDQQPSAPTHGTQRLARVIRLGDEQGVEREKKDYTHCPSCLGIHREEQMRVSRGSPSSDLSVHTRHLLSSAEDEKERRLLMFCDNRQDTSFLSGFLTDRHKRFRLRRCLYQATYTEKDTKFPLFSDKRADSDDYPFAKAVLAKLKKALQDTNAGTVVAAKTLRHSLTADLYNFDKDAAQFDEQREKFFEATEPASRIRSVESEELELNYDYERNSEGRFAVQLLNEAILRDLSYGAYKEGALPTLGLACLWSRGIDALTDSQEKLVAWKIFESLLENGQWTGRPKGLREFTNQRFQKEIKFQDLVRAIVSKRTNLHKFIMKNCPSFRQISDPEKLEQKAQSLLNSFCSHGSIFFHDATNHLLRINSRELYVTREVTVYRSALKKKLETVPTHFNLENINATGKDSDIYEKVNKKGRSELPTAWQKLYCDDVSQDNFVRAYEHNAMLKAGTAADVIQVFGAEDIEKRTINTIVATPTLEMGIDLPDLPTVIHRAVPPDPSNYAQRSGRAGRDKKRAFILAHCGRGSHDTAYFQEPTAMVAGEIIPPGCPRSNTTLLKRHINALCLQLLAQEDMKINDWDSYLDRSEWFKWLIERVGLKRPNSDHVPTPVFDWYETFKRTKNDLLMRAKEITILYGHGLWRPDLLMGISPEHLTQALLQEIRSENFLRTMRNSVEEYSKQFERRKEKYISLPDSSSERWQIIADIKSLVGGFGDEMKTIKPIPWLQTRGILPNFDFPPEVASFTGYRRRVQANGRRETEIAAQFYRGLNQAMREFAPEQNLYAAGSIYKIKKYTVERSSSSRSEQNFGVCSKGCTTLTDLSTHARQCCVCGSKLVGQQDGGQILPPILRLLRAEGEISENIGDNRQDKENSTLIKEVMVVGGNEVERISGRDQHRNGTYINQYQNSDLNHSNSGIRDDTLLDIVTVVGASSKSKTSGRKLLPLYSSSNEADVINVALYADDTETTAQQPYKRVHPFLLGNRHSVEALYFHFNFSQTGLPSSDEIREAQYATFQAAMLKATKRELFLGQRSQSLDSFLDASIVRGSDEDSRLINGIYFYDAVPGGSGVLALMKQNWSKICKRASEILLNTTCCHSACKRCIATFDNQSKHNILDKRTLRIADEKKSIFDLIDDVFNPDSINWARSQPNRDLTGGNEEDISKAEEIFRRLMAERLPNVSFMEQKEIRELQRDREITVPDFVLKTKEKQIAIFVDGYQHHGEAVKFIYDVHKRNYITQKTTLMPFVVPASWIVGPRANSGWDLITNSIRERIHKFEPYLEPECLRGSLGNQDETYIIPDSFSQYEWLFDEPIRLVKPKQEHSSDVIKPIAYDKHSNTLLIETNIHNEYVQDNRIEKSKWMAFWTEMNTLQLKFGKVFVLLRKR